MEQQRPPKPVGGATLATHHSDGPNLFTERSLFAEWLSFTRKERKAVGLPLTEREFAHHYEVGIATLYRWKQSPEFERDLSALRASRVRMQIGGKLPQITAALIKSAKKGNVEAIRTAFSALQVISKTPEVAVGVGVNLEQAMVTSGETWEPPEWAKRARANTITVTTTNDDSKQTT